MKKEFLGNDTNFYIVSNLYLTILKVFRFVFFPRIPGNRFSFMKQIDFGCGFSPSLLWPHFRGIFPNVWIRKSNYLKVNRKIYRFLWVFFSPLEKKRNHKWFKPSIDFIDAIPQKFDARAKIRSNSIHGKQSKQKGNGNEKYRETAMEFIASTRWKMQYFLLYLLAATSSFYIVCFVLVFFLSLAVHRAHSLRTECSAYSWI